MLTVILMHIILFGNMYNNNNNNNNDTDNYSSNKLL